jgi:hypothetical protein
MTGRRKDRGKINSASGHMELMAQEGDARCRRLSYPGTVDAPPAGFLCNMYSKAGLPAEITCVWERLHATILGHLTSALHSPLVSSVSSSVSSASAV